MSQKFSKHQVEKEDGVDNNTCIADERDGFSCRSGGPLGIYFWVEMIEIEKKE